MSDLITLTINGKTIEAKEGEYILNVARANDIFIPAICYLTRCSPTLACRLCLVEADGKQVYSCNTKAKEGMNITTHTENIAKERRAIMEVYDVNHPLQCGVCDQSGECELQNYSLYMKVDSQSYAIKDVPRPAQTWGVMKYDPGLCIVCEKCVTVCKDMIGSNALSTVKRGSDALEKEYKDTMPKDAYSMWNKLNKSLIGFEEEACTDCGECISVCPVGALVSADFQYKSNAWELNKIPAANPHSSDCAFMYYETKHESIENAEPKIYRVTNEHHYSTLNGAARFGYDFENRVQGKDEENFTKAVEAFKNAQSIIFNSYITNEEALILQKIATKTGAKLVNKDAYNYKKFLEAYSSTSGSSLYSSTLKDVHDSNFVVSLGSYLKSDLPNARYALNNSVVMNKGAALYLHPISDKAIEKVGKRGKTTEFIQYKPLAEEAALYLLLDKFGKDLPANIQEYINQNKETKTKIVTETVKETVVELVKDEETGESKEVKKVVSKKVENSVEFEYTKFLDALGLDEKFLDTFEALLDKKDKFSLIVGEDLYTHPKSENLAKLCGLVDRYTDFSVLIIPSQTNTLGVSLICDVTDKEEGQTVGYNEKADFQISALGDGNLDMPALNQQEGTFTNIDKKVIPTNAAIGYKGYVLNDIANEVLESDIEYTIEYTQELPLEAGFKAVDFDKLPNHFGNDRVEYRGYDITSKETTIRTDVEAMLAETLTVNEGETLIYRANPINQFNEFTAIAHEFAKDLESGLFASAEFFEKLELQKGDKVVVSANNIELELNAFIDDQIAGDIAYVSTFQKSLDTKALFDGYRFQKAVIKKA
ncbi:NADH-quinone oxidoreductase subunit G [Halarcobacter ebronensis]|uniref:Ferredoxin n=1 Tax=Halarcobacter ebronensis TaxID=1462615 RepID=A0A4Q1ARQ9_9BACT|nr:NADH-quinone oxidoreductase subunit G [Halarcobacter ebronensis]QKF83346.1 NADH:quinone oxidoreductase I, chain G (cl35703 superfamily) [Halarcobacter ebronensis]RXK05907.1 ferredoxin [Halarcobacter ebronensis]